MAASPQTVIGRALRSKSIVHVHDLTTDPAYIKNLLPWSNSSKWAARGRTGRADAQGRRTVGAIAIYRQEVRPFTDKQIELVSNFAAQAVIAIENTRLLNELRSRFSGRPPPRRCSRSSRVRLASSKPVFDAILENATRICDAKFGTYVVVSKATDTGAPRTCARRASKDRRKDRSAARRNRGDASSNDKPILHVDDISRTLLAEIRRAGRQVGRRPHDCCVPMVKEDERLVQSPFSARRCARSPTSRSSWCRTSLRRR